VWATHIRLEEDPRSLRCWNQLLPPKQVADRSGRYPVPDIQQLAPNANASPLRILWSHPQDQISEARFQARSTDASLLAESCPLLAHQLAMPAQHRLRLDQPAQGGTRDQAAEASRDQAVGGRQLRAFDLPAQDSKLMPQGVARPLDYGLAPLTSAMSRRRLRHE
jgi:hypothetical protein